ncbi:hypothetical protein DRB96_12295 [Streptomyces sp. ICC1]|nr:hypothetical protein DRB89_16335 [Streptomyces sp. ICC4]AWZ12971.1 hypothetical protein DRB96_12295 [Streptomyces sp. ICC1]
MAPWRRRPQYSSRKPLRPPPRGGLPRRPGLGRRPRVRPGLSLSPLSSPVRQDRSPRPKSQT